MGVVQEKQSDPKGNQGKLVSERHILGEMQDCETDNKWGNLHGLIN